MIHSFHPYPLNPPILVCTRPRKTFNLLRKSYCSDLQPMPSLKKFDANVVRHVKLMNKNLCANLIRHEYIVTGRTKAKRAQAKAERFLAKALHENRKLQDQPLAERFLANKALNYLQPPDKREVGTKVIEELSKRYPDRTHGFTRIIKLEPRLGEDKAPMSVLELVDTEFEIKFWYTAKIVARLELQKLQVDALTQHNVDKLTRYRENGEQRFRDAVEEAKTVFFKVDPETGAVTNQEVEKNLQNLPPQLKFHKGNTTYGASKKLPVKPRGAKPEGVVPKSPFLA